MRLKSFFSLSPPARWHGTHQHNGCESIVNDPVTHLGLLTSNPDQIQQWNSRILTPLRLLTTRSSPSPYSLPPGHALTFGHNRAELHDAQAIGGSSTLFHLQLNANIPAPVEWIAGMRKRPLPNSGNAAWGHGRFYCFMTNTSEGPFFFTCFISFRVFECTF